MQYNACMYLHVYYNDIYSICIRVETGVNMTNSCKRLNLGNMFEGEA